MIERQDIKKLASLAKLYLTDTEVERLRRDVVSILGYVSEIQQVSAKSPEAKVGTVNTVMREDGDPHKSGAFSDALLKMVPTREGRYIKVKKIL